MKVRREILAPITTKGTGHLPLVAGHTKDSTETGAKSALYDVLAMVLHEMRAPLGTLTVTVELLDGDLDEFIKQYLVLKSRTARGESAPDTANA